MRWVLTGGGGMFATDMARVLDRAGADVRVLARTDLDILDADACRSAVEGADVVVNAAAWTAVDDAETREADAFAVNAVGPANLGRAAREVGARLVHVSTDYVFDGTATSPYAEDAPVAPRSAYGRTKAAGEWAVRAESPDHLIVRTAWLYGAAGPCFPKTMARLAAERPELSVVDDQVGQPTWTVDLADLVVRLVTAGAPSGTYHGTAAGSVSWFGFTRAVLDGIGSTTHLVPTTSDAFVRPAPRPAYSVLGHEALRAVGVEPIGDWEQRWAQAQAEVLASV
ncbi:MULTISPECIES: dTDP-4-dehydrorhamnose reductase [Cellulosimicrobium]|uniref:dTDP-4-dehydrorhamnose reductase n=1 Tax=Cellulosimicrobium TaxID=157920 RepID=UPI0011A55D14|nr:MULTISPECIES: dTDP-4-dehydrorhamnose reductase [Cellulosimicrobium]MBE9937722.1 dTDP-4-dehydrorhamnose reductase [Cellulosimicrobium cellulans]